MRGGRQRRADSWTHGRDLHRHVAAEDRRQRRDLALTVLQVGVIVVFVAAGRAASGSSRSSQHEQVRGDGGEQPPARRCALRAPRGVLFDRNGKVLVENRNSFNISIVREHTKDLDRTLRVLAAVDRRRRSADPRDRRSPPPRAELPADRRDRGRDARAGRRRHGAPARLELPGRRRARRCRRGSIRRATGRAPVRLRRRGQRRRRCGRDDG